MTDTLKKTSKYRNEADLWELVQSLTRENGQLKEEIRTTRRAAEITANLVVRQFEETENAHGRLRIANAHLGAMLDSAAQIAIIATDPSGIITLFNAGAQNLLGYAPEEVIGKMTPAIFHLPAELDALAQEPFFRKSFDNASEPGRKDRGVDILLHYAQCRRRATLEWTYVRKDGTPFPITLTINPLLDPQKTVIGMLMIAMDISEKKLSEIAIQQSEEKYRLLVKNLPTVVYRCLADGTMEFVDEKIETITGYTSSEILSGAVRLEDLMMEEEGEEGHRTADIQTFEPDHSYISEYRIRAKDGRTVWIEERGQIVHDDRGKIEFITGSLLDITDRKQAWEQMNESEEKYRSLFLSGPMPLFVIDRESLIILDANPMAETVYGYVREDLLHRGCYLLCRDEEGYGCPGGCTGDQVFTECITRQKVRHYRRGKKPFFVNLTACPTRYNNKNVFILAVTDITEMLEKDAQLLQASKMTTLGEMSSGIAHELNQPLSVIKLGSDYIRKILVRNEPPKKETLEQVAREMSQQVDRASEIIQQLKNFSRKPDFINDQQHINLNHPIQNVVKIIGRQLEVREIELRCELEEKLPPVLAHSNLMEQVLFNLIINARDAINQKRRRGDDPDARHRITIRTAKEKEFVSVQIADTGIGIPEALSDRIFEPFFTTKEVGEGMGLGLSIIYRIVKDFSGDIRVESRDGEGTTFRLLFPLHPYWKKKENWEWTAS